MSPSDNKLITGDGRYRDYGIALFRVVLGVVFFMHGHLKFFGMGVDGTTGFFTMLGVPLPALMAWVIPILEMLGGLALVLGIFTPVGLALAADMTGAILFAKRGGGFFAPKGFELELTLLVGSLAVVLTGPGAFALGNLIGGKRAARGS